VRTLTRFKAKISGNVNWAPNKPKLVFTGEALTFIRLSPTVNCHHGINKEITSTINVTIPAAKPNQFTFRFNIVTLAAAEPSLHQPAHPCALEHLLG